MGVPGAGGAGPSGARRPSHVAYYVALVGILSLLIMLCLYFFYYFIKKVKGASPPYPHTCSRCVATLWLCTCVCVRRAEFVGQRVPADHVVPAARRQRIPLVRDSASAMARLCKQVPGAAGKGDTVFPAASSPAALRASTGEPDAAPGARQRPGPRRRPRPPRSGQRAARDKGAGRAARGARGGGAVVARVVPDTGVYLTNICFVSRC
ncbi:hypothetical protein SFRURICE_012116 [Spodoptera frugiperda]|nr:hypothetical protein SFRURICE_012116 [Spodoptera frugiperda]